MNKVWQIAVREFVATVFTKGFIIGLMIFPTIGALMVVFGPRLFGNRESHGRGGDRRRRSDGCRAAACSRRGNGAPVAGGRERDRR